MFMDLQSGLTTLAELQQNQCNGATFFVADQGQIFGFQSNRGTAADQLRQFVRLVDEKKVAAILQRPGCGTEKCVRSAQIIPAGNRSGKICRTA